MSKFEKNTYAPIETAKVDVEVDNSECKLDVSKLKFRLMCNTSINTYYPYYKEQTIIEKELTGPKAAQKDWKE